MINGKLQKLRKYRPENFKFLIIKNMFFEDIDSDINDSFNITIDKIIKSGSRVEYRLSLIHI